LECGRCEKQAFAASQNGYMSVIEELLHKQQKYLSAYFSGLDCRQAEKIVAILRDCRGTVVWSGVGKSGHIAQKIAATFVSTGTKALFLDPTHAAHGDLGYVSEPDVFVALSKSGESHELLNLIPFVRKRNVVCIAIVSSSHNSRLASVCDHSIVLPVQGELCPYNITPTISTAVQLLFGDCLAIALMQSKQTSLGEFAQNHPGGSIGRRISLKVSDLMLTDEMLPLCGLDDRLIHVLPELSAKRCGCLLVVDEAKRLKGIFTDGDLRRALEKTGLKAFNSFMKDLMVANPRVISANSLVWDAMRQMEERPDQPITVLPVVECASIIGLLRMHDILQMGIA
jgi:arabinose-5-phosphate isomerase